MSLEQLNQVLGRAVLDKAFRQKLLSDPSQALKGFDLTPEEIDQLSRLTPGHFDAPGGGTDGMFKFFKPSGQAPPGGEAEGVFKFFDSPGDPPGEAEGVFKFFDSPDDAPGEAEGVFKFFDSPGDELALKNEAQPGPPDVEQQPGPPTFESQPGPPDGPIGKGLPAVQTNPGPPTTFVPDPGPPEKRRTRVLLVGVFLVVMCLLAGLATAMSGAFRTGSTGENAGTEPPVSTEDTAIDTEPPPVETDDTGVTPEVGVCGSVCSADTECKQGLVCSPLNDSTSQCLRNGHCGCGVPCDPNAASACDPGLSCVVLNGQAMCWAGGCDPTPTPACLVIVGDGVCSECENAQVDPQSCAPPPPDDGGGKDKKTCKCTCRTACNAQGVCTKVCRDCNGNQCR